MRKADLVEQVADMIGPRVTKRDCRLVVDAFLNAMKDALAGGDHIEARGLTERLRPFTARKGQRHPIHPGRKIGGKSGGVNFITPLYTTCYGLSRNSP